MSDTQKPDWLQSSGSRNPVPFWSEGLTQDFAKQIFDERCNGSQAELAFQLHCIEGYSRSEISELLGINSAAISTVVAGLKPGTDRYNAYVEALQANEGNLKQGQAWAEGFLNR